MMSCHSADRMSAMIISSSPLLRYVCGSPDQSIGWMLSSACVTTGSKGALPISRAVLLTDEQVSIKRQLPPPAGPMRQHQRDAGMADRAGQVHSRRVDRYDFIEHRHQSGAVGKVLELESFRLLHGDQFGFACQRIDHQLALHRARIIALVMDANGPSHADAFVFSARIFSSPLSLQRLIDLQIRARRVQALNRVTEV